MPVPFAAILGGSARLKVAMQLDASLAGVLQGVLVLMDDRFHANAQGKYLLGCVWFEFFFNASAVGNPFIPEGITAEEAAALQKIAHRVVTEKQRPVPAN